MNDLDMSYMARSKYPLYLELEVKFERVDEVQMKCVVYFDGRWKFGIVKRQDDVRQITWMYVSNYDAIVSLLHQPIVAMFNERRDCVMVKAWFSTEPLGHTFSLGQYAFSAIRMEKCATVIHTLLTSFIQVDEIKLVKTPNAPLLTMNNMAIGVMYFDEYVLARQHDNGLLCVYFNHENQLVDMVSVLLLHKRQRFHISSDFETNLWLIGFGKAKAFASGLLALKETRLATSHVY